MTALTAWGVCFGPQERSNNPTIGLYPTTPTGMTPDDFKLARECNESGPNNITGCALTLAHELGHALFDYGEPQAVAYAENPVRKDFGLPPRKTYRCKDLRPYLK